MRLMTKWLMLALIIYVLGYVAFRQTHMEVWEKDKHAYVIFPPNAPILYYVWRPLTYIDGSVTGMRFHIGPHR